MLFAALAMTFSAACAQQPLICPPADGVALQVLGSGGPIADDARASTSYVVWVDGESRVLIVGCTFRFGNKYMVGEIDHRRNRAVGDGQT